MKDENSEPSILPFHEIMLGSPSAGVSMLVLFGIPLTQWVLLVTLVYTVCLLFVLVRDKIWNRVDKSNLKVMHEVDKRHRPPELLPVEEASEVANVEEITEQ
jgi:hypothetical protein